MLHQQHAMPGILELHCVNIYCKAHVIIATVDAYNVACTCNATAHRPLGYW